MKQSALPGLDQHPNCPGSPKMSTPPDKRRQSKEHGDSIPASPPPLPISSPFVITKNQAFQQHGTVPQGLRVSEVWHRAASPSKGPCHSRWLSLILCLLISLTVSISLLSDTVFCSPPQSTFHVRCCDLFAAHLGPAPNKS